MTLAHCIGWNLHAGVQAHNSVGHFSGIELEPVNLNGEKKFGKIGLLSQSQSVQFSTLTEKSKENHRIISIDSEKSYDLDKQQQKTLIKLEKEENFLSLVRYLPKPKTLQDINKQTKPNKIL